ncbi:MAG: HD domain-containing protein [Bdellovibrionales bacterium]|jgi:putative hydrolase of HD superfamily
MKVIKDFTDLYLELCNKPRAGWVARQVKQPETVWQHTERVTFLSEEYAPQYLGKKSVFHCKMLGLSHDLPEGIMHDITPHDRVTKKQKQDLEFLVIDHIGMMPYKEGDIFNGAVMREYFLEYEAQETPAAKFVGKIDKLQMGVEALNIELTNRCAYSLQPFWDYIEKHLQDSPLMEVFVNLKTRRPASAYLKPEIAVPPKPPGFFEQIQQEVLIKMGRLPIPKEYPTLRR